jgi:hypothetical protein
VYTCISSDLKLKYLELSFILNYNKILTINSLNIMKKIKTILSVITFCIILISCSQEKVSESQIKFNYETYKYELNGESFTGIGVRELKRDKIRFYYYEDGVRVKKIQGFSLEGKWEMGDIQWEKDVKSKEVDGKTIYQTE